GAQVAEAGGAGTLGHASSVVLTRALACAVLLGEYDEALNVAETAQSVEPHGRGGFTAADRWFYHALTLTVLTDTAPPEQRRAWAAKLDELQAALDGWGAARKVEQLDQVLARLSGQPVPAPDALDLLAALQTTQTRYSLLDAAIAALPVPVVVLDADRNLRASSVPGTAVAGDVPATPL